MKEKQKYLVELAEKIKEADKKKEDIVAKEGVQIAEDQVKMEKAAIASRIENIEHLIKVHGERSASKSPQLEGVLEAAKKQLEALQADEKEMKAGESSGGGLSWFKKLILKIKNGIARAKTGMAQIKEQMGAIDVPAMFTKPLKSEISQAKMMFREKTNGVRVANVVAPLHHHRPISMLRSARRGRRNLLHVNKLVRNENGKQHLVAGSAGKKYCGTKQTRYHLNIIKAWYGNPKRLWSTHDGIDVTALLQERVNTTTNELHLYPDEDVELYYHSLFGINVDPYKYEEEEVYELILKYRYDDTVTGKNGAEEECHSHIVTDDKFSLDIMYNTKYAQCTSRIGNSMIHYEEDINNCIEQKRLSRRSINNKELKWDKIRNANLNKIQKQIDHLTYVLHDSQPGFNKTKFIPFHELPLKEHKIDTSNEWVTLSEKLCFGPNVVNSLGTFKVPKVVEHVVEFKLTVLKNYRGEQIINGISCNNNNNNKKMFFGCDKNNEAITQVLLTETNSTHHKRRYDSKRLIIAPPENTRIDNYHGHGQAFKWLGSCSSCNELTMEANLLYTFEPGKSYRLIYSSSFDNLFSDLTKYYGKTCVKLQAHQCPLCAKYKTFSIQDNDDVKKDNESDDKN
jgi:hypothetical protein